MNPLRVINSISGSLKYLTHAVPSVAAALLGLAPTAQAQPPVTSGLVLRMDASQITGTANDAQLNTWADASGMANNAVRQIGSSAGFPKYVTGALNGQPVVRFNSGNGNTGDYFKFNRISTIRSVFWVIKDTSAGNRFLLGDDITYQFHRGNGANAGKLWDGSYASDSIRNGTTKLMGNAINGVTTSLPSGSFQLVSLVTTGNVQANQICQDRTFTGSWQGDIAEILIYDRALTGAEELEVGTYLSAKYALTTAYPPMPAPAAPTGVVAAPVSSGTISLSWPVVPFATTYNVSYALAGDPEAMPVTGVLGASYTATGLTNGMSYDFKVSATNIAGTSAYSSIVTATPELASGKDILTFVFPGQQDTVITGTDISVTVPIGTDLTMLAPTYTASPYASGSPVSGSTLSFTSAQLYTITAEDLTTKDYTVTVTEGAVPKIFTWASAAFGNWSESAKWTNNLATGTKPSDGGRADYTLNFTPAGNYTTTQNLNNGFLLNQLNFAGAVTLAGTNSLALTNNETTPPAISQNSGNTVTISAPLNLTADTTFGGSGGGQVIINSGAISGIGGLTKSSSGELLITNVNSYTGKTSVNAGILRIGGTVAFTKAGVNGPLGAPVGANATIDLHNGTTLQTIGTTPRINHDTDRPLNLAGTGPGTVSLRVNDNDTRFTFGSVTASGTGAKTLALFMGSQGNGDRESMVFTGGISDSSDATPTSLNVSFNTTNSAHLSLVGTSTFTGPISTVNANSGLNSVSTLTVGGLFTGPNSANGLAAENVRGTGSLGSGNYPGNISLGSKTLLNYRSSVAQTLAGVISGAGAVTVDGLSTVTMTGANTYTGNTTVPTGNTLALTDTSSMSFVLTNTSANKITGVGTASLDGTFTINTAAVSNVLGTWTLVDTTTKSFGASFAVAGFTEVDNVWTRVDGTKTWTFTEATGGISLTSTAVFSSFGIPGYAGVIDNDARTIRLVVPKNTNLATLAPTYTVASGTVDQPNDGITPPSPTFAAAVNNTVTYVLSSELGDKNYAVTVVPGTGIINLRVSDGNNLSEAVLEGPAGPVVPGTQKWNQVTALPALSASSLLDSVGAPTVVGFSASVLEGSDDWGINAPLKLLSRSARVFSTAPGNSGSFTISGLTAGTYYDLWIASSHINGSGIGTWSTLNTNTTGASVGIDNTGASTNGTTWVAGVNYVRFESVKVNVSGNITMTVMNDVLLDNRVGFNGFQLIPVAAPIGTDYDTWVNGFPSITAPADKLPTADPDGDGMNNQEEYAFGLDPSSGSSANPITVQLNKTSGKFSYTRRGTPAITGITYTVLTSSNLVAWTADSAAVQTVTGTVGDVETVEVALTGAPLTASKFFVRVQAVPAP